jgi:hypothetical protein
MTEQDRGGEALRGEVVAAGAPKSMREWAEKLVARAREDVVALTGDGGRLTDLMRHVLQTDLEAEMAEHLGNERGEAPPGGVGNPRNGGYDKTVTTDIGVVGLRVPRNRLPGRGRRPEAGLPRNPQRRAEMEADTRLDESPTRFPDPLRRPTARLTLQPRLRRRPDASDT